eukprot:548433-Rhodomonas_salina.3
MVTSYKKYTSILLYLPHGTQVCHKQWKRFRNGSPSRVLATGALDVYVSHCRPRSKGDARLVRFTYTENITALANSVSVWHRLTPASQHL